jgi:hypothetical protein
MDGIIDALFSLVIALIVWGIAMVALYYVVKRAIIDGLKETDWQTIGSRMRPESHESKKPEHRL